MIKDGTAGDRCRGVLVGLAAGDLNGGPTRMALRLADKPDESRTPRARRWSSWARRSEGKGWAVTVGGCPADV